MIITVGAHKGGVGKTTTAVMLSLLLARYGPTVLVDGDPQASALTWFDEAVEDGWSAPESHSVVQWTDPMTVPPLGHVVIDTPPGSPERLRAALRLSTHAVIPLGARRADVAQLGATVEDVNDVVSGQSLTWAALLTMVRTGTHEARTVPAAINTADLPLLDTVIPSRADFARLYGTIPEPAGRGPWTYYADVLAELGADELVAS